MPLLNHSYSSDRFSGVWGVIMHFIFDFLMAKSPKCCKWMYGSSEKRKTFAWLFERVKSLLNYWALDFDSSLFWEEIPRRVFFKARTVHLAYWIKTVPCLWIDWLIKLLVIAGICYELLVYPCWLILENPEMSLSLFNKSFQQMQRLKYNS